MESFSKACLSIPPVIAKDYPSKGSYTTLAEFKTYVTGPTTSTKGIIDIYDVFGITDQVIQGADRLSGHTSALVLMPDFFDGIQFPAWAMARDTPEKQEAMNKFGSETSDLAKNVAVLMDKIMPAAKSTYPSVTSWGVFGRCWGGKVAVLSCLKDPRLFRASAQVHPARMTVEDAQQLKETGLPHLCLASDGEPKDVVKEYAEILGDKGTVETYDTFHGWMGARADLGKEDHVKNYERGYQQTAEFFVKHL